MLECRWCSFNRHRPSLHPSPAIHFFQAVPGQVEVGLGNFANAASRTKARSALTGNESSAVVSPASCAEKARAAEILKQHQHEQYRDRLVYWSLRFASRVKNDVLTIVVDDMDHSKFAWPQKMLDDLRNVVRPTMTFTGALAHGFGTTRSWPDPRFRVVLTLADEGVCPQSDQQPRRATAPPALGTVIFVSITGLPWASVE